MRLPKPKLLDPRLVALAIVGMLASPIAWAESTETPATTESDLIASSFESDAAGWVRNIYKPNTKRSSGLEGLSYSTEENPGLGMNVPLSEHSAVRFGAQTQDLDVDHLRTLDVDTWHLGLRFTWN